MRPIVALSGRRIDAPGAEERFPLARVGAVRDRLRALMVELQPRALVCSAACGADLLALEVAGELRVRRRIVLPFAVEKFRETSVVDRPGAWGDLYDRVVADARSAGDLVLLAGAGEDDEAYAAAAEAILDQALALSGSPGPEEVLAIVVWEGTRRKEAGITGTFADSARRRQLAVREISTLAAVTP